MSQTSSDVTPTPSGSTAANERMKRPLDDVDPQIADVLRQEARRQATGLELIPSENLVSEAVLEAMGSILDRKSTRLNSSHGSISYAVFCLKKKKKRINNRVTCND